MKESKDLVKDPFVLEFLDIKENTDYLESDLEKNILEHLKEFLLELGKGVMFVGSQVRLTLEEDNLCAYYIKSILEGTTIELEKEIEKLKTTSGAKFFDDKQKDVFPEEDFYLSTEVDKFNFVLKVEKDSEGMNYIKKIDIV